MNNIIKYFKEDMMTTIEELRVSVLTTLTGLSKGDLYSSVRKRLHGDVHKFVYVVTVFVYEHSDKINFSDALLYASGQWARGKNIDEEAVLKLLGTPYTPIEREGVRKPYSR
jgi:hypothetical protein